MSNRIYSKYDSIHNFVNRGILPKTKPETLAIADVFHNFKNNRGVQQSKEQFKELHLLTAKKSNWKERRLVLQKNRTLCRELIGRLLKPHLVYIPRDKLQRFRNKRKKTKIKTQ